MQKTVVAGVVVLTLVCIVAGSRSATAARPSLTPVQERAQRYSIADREGRLADKALTAGNPVMIRIFKQESQLELWMMKGNHFELFEIYPICLWSGKLGPKSREGDRQAPEGFYRIDVSQLRLKKGRNARTFYIDFPNALDRTLGRTGSAIMVHGGCHSIGCFAMTDAAMEEIFSLVEMALYAGQDGIDVHAFPFRMTPANFALHAQSPWHGYWLNLRDGYDAFEQTRVPPRVSSCGDRYVVEPGDLTAPALPDIGSPPTPRRCETEVPDTASGRRPGIVISRLQEERPARRAHVARARRNAHAAYTGKRRYRMAVYSRRTRTSAVAGRPR
jgi:murein L,D-transpeptidase YafK